MAIVRFNLTRNYKRLMFVIVISLFIILNYSFLMANRNDEEQHTHTSQHHLKPTPIKIEQDIETKIKKIDIPNNRKVKPTKPPTNTQPIEDHNHNHNNNNHNNHNNNNNYNNHNNNNHNDNNNIPNYSVTILKNKVEEPIISLHIEKATEEWTWDREEKHKCHYSNKRNYFKQPMTFGFHSWYKKDDNCEIPCLNQGSSTALDGSIHSPDRRCSKSVYFTMENVGHGKGDYDIFAGIYLDTDVPLPMFGWNQYTYAEEPKPKDSKNQGLVAAFISNCGPRRRLDWLKALNAANATVDSYGSCERNKDIPHRSNLPNDYNGQKLRVGETYKFIMAFENSHTDDYVTEKLFGVLAVGSVPIYDGAPNGKKFAPNNHSVIFASDFETPEKLAEYLLYLDKHDDEYQKYLEWKKIGPTRDWTAMVDIARIGAECRVCYRIADLHRKEVGMVFGDEEIRKKYIKVPSDWNKSKGIVVYIRNRGSFWFYSVPIPYDTTANKLQEIIEKTIPHVGEFYEAYEYWTKDAILNDKFTKPTNITLKHEMEIEAVFVDMNFYFTNTPRPK